MKVLITHEQCRVNGKVLAVGEVDLADNVALKLISRGLATALQVQLEVATPKAKKKSKK